MANTTSAKRSLIEGRAALIVIDIQASTFIDSSDMRAIANMPGYKERMERARVAVDAARESSIPVIFIQEVHRPDLVDFGRELDGDEDVHCLEDDPGTDIAKKEMDSSRLIISSGSGVTLRSSVRILKSCCVA